MGARVRFRSSCDFASGLAWVICEVPRVRCADAPARSEGVWRGTNGRLPVGVTFLVGKTNVALNCLHVPTFTIVISHYYSAIRNC